jgi:hypothetical protein
MPDSYDPTAILREGKRVSEIRYHAEFIFRDRLREDGALDDAKTSLAARRAIVQACHFEAEWAIATISMHEEEDLPLLTTEEDLVAAILEEQEL